MKIVQVTQHFHPHLGGVETHVLKTSLELIKQGHQVVVLTRQTDKTLPLQEEYKEISIIRFPINVRQGFLSTNQKFLPLEFGILGTLKALSDSLSYKLQVWRQISKQGQLFLSADVIQVHDVYWWLFLLNPLFGKKTYLTFHGWEGKHPVPLRYKLARFIWSSLARKTIHIGKYIQKFYWDQPDLILFGGVEKKLLDQPLKKITSLKKLKIAFLGRLEKENDIKAYLGLVKKLKKELPIPLEITWVGDGSYHSECAQLGKVTGMVRNPASYLSKADLVFSSSYLSILSAQALGKVVVAVFTHPLKKSYLESYPGAKAMLIHQNIDSLAKEIANLINQPSIWSQYSHFAREFAQKMTWKKVAHQYLDFWKR